MGKDFEQWWNAEGYFYMKSMSETLSEFHHRLAKDAFNQGYDFANSKIEEGCTPADAKKLREANHSLMIELEEHKAMMDKVLSYTPPRVNDLMKMARMRRWRV